MKKINIFVAWIGLQKLNILTTRKAGTVGNILLYGIQYPRLQFP